jgi:hypothetical protein
MSPECNSMRFQIGSLKPLSTSSTNARLVFTSSQEPSWNGVRSQCYLSTAATDDPTFFYTYRNDKVG